MGWLNKYDDSIIAQGGETISSSREERGLKQRLYNTIQPGIYPENFSQWAYNIRNVINNNNRFDSTRQVKNYDKLSDKLLKADESNDYDQVQNILNEMDHIKEFQSEDDPYSEDGWLKYLGLPQKNNTFTTSDYKPSRSENPNTTYYKLPNEFEKELLELYQKKLIKLPEDSIVNEKLFENVFGENKSRARVLHYFKFGEDQDDKGKYISYYDKYDLNPEVPIIGKINIPIGDPYEIYNRIYLDQTPRKEQGGTIPKAQEGVILQREGMKESPFSFLIPEKSGKGTGRTSKYFTELSNYYKGDASYPYQYLSGSEYRPTMGNNEDVQYMSIQDEPFKQRIVEEFNKGKKKGNKVNVSYAKDLDPLGKFSIYEGKDEGGEYLSYYDKWDVNPLADMIGKPFELYDRIYVEKNAEGKYVPKKFAEGGSMSYTPEYIEQLKQFENRPDNLAYHLDNKKIPTIGWGHRITEEELKRKAIKMGKEWIPYEKFSGKEGRQYADRLMELDVAHHYNRLERQVGKDTLATLPPEVHDVLLDITYNRGSLGDSLEYVKSGDIAGLRDYLAETSKGLKGGAKTRMEWRANRIPVKTLPPVEAPINYNVENQYVPEVLQSIAEQPSTQDIIPIQDNEGYRNQENYGKPVQIVSNRPTTSISMDQVPFPILAMSDTGELKIMFPGEEHEFEGGSVTELPIAQEGDIIKSKQLRTFTEDNGWLNKYKEL